MCFTVGRGTALFTLDPESGDYILTTPAAAIPPRAKEFAINCSNMRHWQPPVRRYIDELVAGKAGPRGKDYNMRWVAALVAEVHRILMRGGVFLYPRDNRDPARPGKLRLMYECNPMSWLAEQAGGKSVNGLGRVLEIQPETLHQRVALMLGASEEIDILMDYHK